MADYENFQASATSPGISGRLVVASGTNLDPFAKAIVCTTAGNVTLIPVDNLDGVPISFVGCPVGFIPPFRVRRVTALTGAWATVDG